MVLCADDEPDDPHKYSCFQISVIPSQSPGYPGRLILKSLHRENVVLIDLALPKLDHEKKFARFAESLLPAFLQL